MSLWFLYSVQDMINYMTSVPSKQENSFLSNGSKGKMKNKNIIFDTKFSKQDLIIGSLKTYEEFKYVKNNGNGMRKLEASNF